MFITYHRVGWSAVRPALAAAGLLVFVGGIAAMIALVTLAVVGVCAFGSRLLRAFGPSRPGGRWPSRPTTHSRAS